ncbi:MAG: YncE family protein [Acidobacteria bacterium]|nr:YncE family protein [Acidobacteriota bacterium]
MATLRTRRAAAALMAAGGLATVSLPSVAQGRLALRTTITGQISPKSVVASGTGLVTAQNMMYTHTITVYDARTMKLTATIPDAVQLSRFGVKGHPGVSRGAPVEAAFSPGGLYAYVTNYAMYGRGFGPEGKDTCTPSSGTDRSFAYRLDMEALRIDRVYPVGSVPKVVAVTPDGARVLVSNWCSWDLTVIDAASGKVVRTLPMGAYPRGIAVSGDGRFALVAIMGSSHLLRVDLRNYRTRQIEVGSGPRAVVLSDDSRTAYVTLNAEGRVAKVNLRTGRVARVATGSAPRSLARSADGRALYVVNYESGSVSKLRTRDMRVLQTVQACEHPIGITYEPTTRRVWVACYGGAILVFDDR